jgi:hypothetical protein
MFTMRTKFTFTGRSCCFPFMLQKCLSMAVFFYLALISHQASACDDHFYLNSDDFGVVKGAVLRLAGLVAPEPVFKLKHSPVEKAMLGEAS